MIYSSIKKIVPIVFAIALIVVEIVAIYFVHNAKSTGQIDTKRAPANQETTQNTSNATSDEGAVNTPRQDDSEAVVPQNNAVEKKSIEPVDRGNSTVENLPEVPFPIQ